MDHYHSYRRPVAPDNRHSTQGMISQFPSGRPILAWPGLAPALAIVKQDTGALVHATRPKGARQVLVLKSVGASCSQPESWVQTAALSPLPLPRWQKRRAGTRHWLLQPPAGKGNERLSSLTRENTNLQLEENKLKAKKKKRKKKGPEAPPPPLQPPPVEPPDFEAQLRTKSPR